MEAVQIKSANGTSSWLFEDCLFYRNHANSSGYASGLRIVSSTLETNTDFRMRNCVFAENRMRGASLGVVETASGGASSWRRFEGCDFVGNTAKCTAESSVCVHSTTVGIRFYFDGCSFRNNLNEGSSDASGGASVFASSSANNFVYLVNCTVVSNSVDAGRSAVSAGTVAMQANNQRLFIVHSVFADNVLAAESPETSVAEIEFSKGGKNCGFSAVNSILKNSSAGYVPMTFNSESVSKFCMTHCFVSGIDISSMSGFARLDAISSSGDPKMLPLVKGAGAAYVMGVSKSSPYRKAGMAVYYSDYDGSRAQDFKIETAVYDPEFFSAKNPWYLLFETGVNARTPDYAFSNGGISLESPLLADALGTARSGGRIAYGPLNAPTSGLIILLR